VILSDPTRTKVIASLLTGFLAAGAGWIFLQAREQALLHRAGEREVLVAARYVPAYTHLNGSWLASRKIPSEFLSKGTLDRLEDLQDLTTLAPFNAGEPILFNKLAHSSQSLAAAVPEGKRAFTLGVDAMSGVAGLVRPGDLVDVLTLNATEKSGPTGGAVMLFQAIQVLAAGSQYSDVDKILPESVNTVTLALNPREVQTALAAQARGRLQLALRPSGDTEPADLTQPSPARP
jgi:pilus assembly protein CpaB